MGGGLQVIIVSVHVLYIGLTPVLCMLTLDRRGCQVLQFTLVYIGGQGRGAKQNDVFVFIHY